MPRSYRSIILAAFAGLILGAAPAPNHSGKSKQESASEQIQAALDRIATAQDKLAKPSDPGEYQKPCGEAGDNYNSDLCAQWTAATAATEAARWALWSLGIGIIGAVGIVAALYLTIESNRIARDTAKRQLRAYIGVEPGGVERESDDIMRLPLVIHNSGQTPAHHVIVFSKFEFTDQPREFDPRREAGGYMVGEANDITFGPGVENAVYIYADAKMVTDNGVEMSEKKLALIHFGYVSYQDAFGEARETRFAFYHWGEELSDTETRRCRFGNSST